MLLKNALYMSGLAVETKGDGSFQIKSDNIFFRDKKWVVKKNTEEVLVARSKCETFKLKICHSNEPHRVRRLFRERNAFEKLPAFVQECSVPETLGDFTFISSLWRDGVSLGALFKASGFGLSDSSHYLKLEYIERMIEQVDYHSQMGFLHGDIQPGHFFKDSQNYFFIDWENFVDTSEKSHDYAGGLIHFASPKVAKGMLRNSFIDYDIVDEKYSLASTIFYLLSGQTLFGTEDKNLTFEEKMKLVAYSEPNELEASDNIPAHVSSFVNDTISLR